MEWKWRQNKQLEWKECEKITKSNTCQKTQNIFQQNLTSLPYESFIPQSSEEIKATRARQLEVERMKSIVIEHARCTMYR